MDLGEYQKCMYLNDGCWDCPDREKCELMNEDAGEKDGR